MATIVCVLLWKNHHIYAVSLGVGITIGIILRYSRFCFAAAFRDPFITGNTKVIRGVILGLIVSTIGFGMIQSRYLPNAIGGYEMIPGAISAVGINVMIGAFIFGIGMVLAGGCASGLLMRIGEGHTVHLVVIIGFIIGTVLGAKDYGFWYKILIKDAKIIYFPDYLNLKIVVLIQVTILFILYIVALWYEKTHVKQ
ncbi:MAG TPA: YeeE/YedE family protein [Epulopiscium sp.]|nr:YeeE/YedE family protein [Candidatus Epulonipiscium sp.]